MSCNRNDFDIDNEFWGVNKEIKLWVNDGTLKDIQGAVQIGGAAGAGIYAILVESGVITAGALSGPVTVAVGTILGIYLGWIMIENDGCGVVIEMNVNPVAPVTTTPVVYSQ